MFRKGEIVLFAPLNWGLGHASRSITLIHQAIDEGCDVMIASDNEALDLLEGEFPQIKTFKLPSYHIQYRFESIVLNILWQLPYIITTYYKERKVIQQLVKENNINLIVSDNRFGAFSKSCKSVYVTHQLNILHPWKIVSWVGTLIHRWVMLPYDQIWVPDHEGDGNLSGKLSKLNTYTDKKVQWIGPLTRLKKMVTSSSPNKVLVIISGPEPQRSFFEVLVADALISISKETIIIRGTNKPVLNNVSKHFSYKNMAKTQEIQQAISDATVIICRSGYSSIMDLSVFDKNIIYIPTPGQTEQLYLGKYHAEKNDKIFCLQQHEVKEKLLEAVLSIMAKSL
jgi:predicted glycosyltransferase